MKDDSSIFSFPCTIYTYHFEKPKTVVKFRKVSEIPISTDTSCWSAKSGDSIIYKDIANRYAVVNVHNAASPATAGFVDSALLVRYSQTTLIPIFLKFGIRNSYLNIKAIECTINDATRILVLKGNEVCMAFKGTV